MELNMENRLCLNKRKVYELPDEVLVGDYRRNVKIPNFEPDICVGCFGVSSVGKIVEKGKLVKELWVKTNNKDLLEFIRQYNWRNRVITTTNRTLSLIDFKKIILEEFYGVKYGK